MCLCWQNCLVQLTISAQFGATQGQVFQLFQKYQKVWFCNNMKIGANRRRELLYQWPVLTSFWKLCCYTDRMCLLQFLYCDI